MSESVFHAVQLGRQAGTLTAPGAQVPATVLYPVSEAVVIELDRATQYPEQDWGRNAKARAATGFHGVRGANFPLNSQLRLEDFILLAEAHYAGDISPTGDVWAYPFEVGLPTVVPLSVESGTEATQDQWAAVGALCDEMTISFDDLDAPGAHPWTVESTWLALNRVASATTGGVDLPTGLETVQGQNSLFKIGSMATAYGSLSELEASLISFSCHTMKHLELRPYGGDTDGASGFGFAEKFEGEVTFKLKISAANKTAVYDKWENGSPFADDVRIRIDVPGSGTKYMHLDLPVGLTAVPVGTRGGERVYECTGVLLDDEGLDAMGMLTIKNGITSLPGGGS